MKRTYQPSVLVKKRRHGFLQRLRNDTVILSRKAKGRHRLAK
jgi:large subunit ribosomal protein L34